MYGFAVLSRLTLRLVIDRHVANSSLNTLPLQMSGTLCEWRTAKRWSFLEFIHSPLKRAWEESGNVYGSRKMYAVIVCVALMVFIDVESAMTNLVGSRIEEVLQRLL